MEYEVYINDRGRYQHLLNVNGEPLTAKSDMALLDLISTFFLDENQEITRTTPQYMGHDNIEIKIYPKFTRKGLVLNKKTLQIRRVKNIGVHYLVLFNTDDVLKSGYQENGYILYRHVEVKKDDWIPIDEATFPNLYHAGSSIGKDPDFDKMEFDGITSL